MPNPPNPTAPIKRPTPIDPLQQALTLGNALSNNMTAALQTHHLLIPGDMLATLQAAIVQWNEFVKTFGVTTEPDVSTGD